MLEWTGERFIPGEGGTDIHYEHTHRYSAVAPLTSGLRVLDVGSGEGYGSAILATRADHVVGIDVDGSAITHAQRAYGSNSRLHFRHVEVGPLPFEDAEFDLIVCFEVIEHLAKPEALLPELARVLAPSGTLLISTPNKWLYSDERNYRNEFHLREFYIEEFREFLGTSFRNVQFFAQRLIATSVIWKYDQLLAGQTLAITPEINPVVITDKLPTIEPMYIVAACSNGNPLLIDSSFLTTSDQALTTEMDGSVPYTKVRQLLDDMDEERARAQAVLDAWEAELEVRANTIRTSEAEIVTLRRRLIELSEELRRTTRT